MNLCFAGNVKGDKADATDYGNGVRNRLVSYADVDGWADDSFAFWIASQPAEARVFLDSGAFGAHTRGAKLDLGQYCDYIRAHASALHAYAALDVIGDWRATAENLKLMRAQGLDPVPVFHSGEPYELLGDIAASCGYIALGGMASDSPAREDLQKHLDRCFAILEKHWPVRVHGFGIMAQWALERYPFYSVDSSAAIVSAGMGRVMRFTGGRLVADGWKEDVRATLDGEVADHVSTLRSARGSAHAGRRLRNIQAVLRLERHVTEVWTMRGVSWAS